MEQIEQQRPMQPSSVQLVRNILTLLANLHPSIKPDDIAHLPDNLLNWDNLVKVNFPAEWNKSIQSMLAEEHEFMQQSGKERLATFKGENTLHHLWLDARRGNLHAHDQLCCAVIIIGNLIADQIYLSNPDLTIVIQKQVNSLWNANANQALSEAFGDGKLVAFLPEYNPTAPELSDLED